MTLLADVGGTHTRLAIADGNSLRPDSICRYSNCAFTDFNGLLEHYMDQLGTRAFARSCTAVAGPVDGGKAILTNIDWKIETDAIASLTRSTESYLLNDLQAQGYGVTHLQGVELRRIACGKRPRIGGQESETKLVVGVGTGINATCVFRTGSTWYASPSECGHASLPVQTTEEIDLLRYLAAESSFVSIEDVLSGPGIERVYRWQRSSKRVTGRVSSREIVRAARHGDKAALQTVSMVVGLLGTVCGDLALIHLPLGGVYLAGGVARSLAPFMDSCGFHDRFLSKGRFSDFMPRFSVCVIESDYTALQGCLNFLDSIPQAGSSTTG